MTEDGLCPLCTDSLEIGIHAFWDCAFAKTGYAMSFGNESIFKVETRAMLEGLFLAWDKGFRKVEVESDNALLVELLLSGGGASSSLIELQLLHRVLHQE
ncbi:hypothetical protein PVK06_020445 [Gossypium arboreum]|uniref:RNase H type-1 domain-containing protein n=1 Tax=Gossypium arboreum TaxID=29729 RepID=A0ABR0PMD0_GOSAR|nr:hypothetical protein PVK06_020445 [Gossypium arboreum]